MKKILSIVFTLILLLQTGAAAFAGGNVMVEAQTGGSISLIEETDTYKIVEAVPAPGYKFSYWSYTVPDGPDQTSTKNPITFTKYENANRSAFAIFTKEQYTVTVIAGNGGSVSGGGIFEYGASVSISATADSGFSFSHWESGGFSVSNNPSEIFPAVSNITYTAVFSGQMHTINASPDPVGSGVINNMPSFSGSFNYAETPTVTLTATPLPGYIFDGWYENGSRISSSISTAFFTNSDKNIIAKFSSETTSVSPDPVNPDPINPESENPDAGSPGPMTKYKITYNPGSYSLPGSTSFTTEWYAGNVFLLGQYYSRQGYTQTGWSETDGGSKIYNLNAQIVLNRNMMLYPYWENVSVPLYLTVNIGSGGSVRLSGGNVPKGWTGKLEPNQSFTFYFHPDPGNYVYRIGFAGWHHPVQSGNSFTVSYEMMQGRNQTLQILFADSRSHPPTGDDSHIALWTGFGVMSLAAFIFTLRKKKQ